MSEIKNYRAVMFELEYRVPRRITENTTYKATTMGCRIKIKAIQTPEGVKYEINNRSPNPRKNRNDPRRLITDALLQITAKVGGGYCDTRGINWGLARILPRLLMEDSAFKKACEVILQYYGETATVCDFMLFEGSEHKLISHIACGFKANLKGYHFVELEEGIKTSRAYRT